MTSVRQRLWRKRSSSVCSQNTGLWTEEDVHNMLVNPIYGWGIFFESPDAVEAIKTFEEQLAREQRERGCEFSIQELETRFQQLFDEWIATHRFEFSYAPPAIEKDLWLRTQQVIINRLARGEKP